MAERVTKVRLEATVQDYIAGMEKAARSTRDVESAAGKLKAQQEVLEGVGKASLAVGSLAAVGVGLAVAKFAEFDKAMSGVQAATHESAENMELLRNAALDAGADTVFTASEAAGAIEELAKAGVDTADVLGGGLKGALDLAAAGEIAVADAAETAASAMTQFGLAGSDVPHIADLLAAAAGKAQGGVSDMSAALNQSGLVASQMGLSIEETTGSLAAFASAGLIGSDAGTSFRAMLLRLANPTDESKQRMAELGLAVYDAQGNFIGMEALAGQLQERLGGLTQETRNQTLALLFGQDAIRSASILYEQGADGIQKWTDRVNDSGYAAETAEIRLDNLAGDIERLGGAFDTALIKTGSAANDALRGLVQAAEGLVDGFANAPQGVQDLAMAVGGLTAAVGLVGGAAILAVPKIAAFKVSLEALGVSAQKSQAALTGLRTAAVALTAVAVGSWAAQTVGGFIDSAREASGLKETVDSLIESVDALGAKGTIGKLFDDNGFNQLSVLTDGSWWSDGARSMYDWFGIISDNMPMFKILGADSKNVARELGTLDKTMAGLVQSGKTEEAIALYEELAAKTNGSKDALKRLDDLLPKYSRSMHDGGEASEQFAGSVDYAAQASQYAADAMEESAAASQKWLEMVTEADAAFIDLGGAYDAVIEKNKAFAESTADSTEDASDSWTDYYDGVTVGFQDFLAELQAQVDAQDAWEQNMILLAGRVSEGTLQELARLGPEGAPLVADMVNASDEELARMDSLFRERGAQATGTFATTLTEAQTVIRAASGQLGQGAANEIAAKLASGTATVEQIMQQYGLKIEGLRPQVQIGTEEAQANLDAFIAANNGRTVFLGSRVSTGPGGSGGIDFADGGRVPHLAGGSPSWWEDGVVRGPGGPRQDLVAANLSPGEFVVNAYETARHLSTLKAINSGQYAGETPIVQVAAPAAPQVTYAPSFPIQPIRDIEPAVAATIVGREAGRYMTSLGVPK